MNTILVVGIVVMLLLVIYLIFKKPEENTPTTKSISTSPTTSVDNKVISIIKRLNFTNTEHFNSDEDCKTASILECNCDNVKLSNKSVISANIPCLLNLLYDIYLIDSDSKKYIEDYYKEMTRQSILDMQLKSTENMIDVVNNLLPSQYVSLLIQLLRDKNNITQYKYKNMRDIIIELYTNNNLLLIKLMLNLNDINSILHFTKCNDENCITQCDKITPIAENQSKNTIYMKLDIKDMSTTTSNMTDKFTDVECNNIVLNNDNTLILTKEQENNLLKHGIRYNPEDLATEENFEIMDEFCSFIKEQNEIYKNVTIPSNLLPTKLMDNERTINDYINKMILKQMVYNIYLYENGINADNPYSSTPTTTANISKDVLDIKQAIYNDILYTFINFSIIFSDFLDTASTIKYTQTFWQTMFDGTRTSDTEEVPYIGKIYELLEVLKREDKDKLSVGKDQIMEYKDRIMQEIAKTQPLV
jgi:hypothetical protein